MEVLNQLWIVVQKIWPAVLIFIAICILLIIPDKKEKIKINIIK